MGLALRLARRSLAQHPARTLFSVAGIAVGIATVVGLFTLDYNTLIGRHHSSGPEWQAEIEVSPSLAVTEPHAELERTPGVRQVAAAFQTQALVRVAGSGEVQTGDAAGREVALVALEAEHARGLNAYFVERGDDLPAAGAAPRASTGAVPVLVGGELARRFALEPGSALRLARPASLPRTECVEGQWRTVSGGAELPAAEVACRVAGVLAREGLGRKGAGDVVVMPYGDGLRLFEGAHVETRYWLARDPEVNLERLQESLGRAWSYDLQASVVIGQAADERAFRNGVRFAGILALMLGLYVIFHTLSMSLVERVREIGVLHALGATRAQIGRAFLTEALVVAGGGGLLGCMGGLVMAKLLLLVGVTTVGRGWRVDTFFVPWRAVATLVLGGVGIALSGSIFPLARARRTHAVAALRGEADPELSAHQRTFRLLAALLLAVALPALYFFAVPLVGEAQRELIGVALLVTGVLALFVAVPLIAPAAIAWTTARCAGLLTARFPLSGRLATKDIARGAGRIAGGVAGIALVTAGYVGLRGMTHALEGEIRVWGHRAFFDKVFVRGIPRTPFEELAQRVEAIPDVIGIEANAARAYAPFLILGLREAHLGRYGPCADDPDLARRMREEGGAILSTRLANHRGYQVGDFLHVRSPRGDVTDLPVIAISDAYGYFSQPDERLYAVVSDAWMAKLFCVDASSTESFAVRLGPGADVAAVEDALRALYAQDRISVESGPYLYRWYTHDVRRDFVLFDILIVLTAALAGLGILNGQLLSALERARELGLLKALGVSAGQIAGTVAIESAAIGAVGGALGCALGGGLAPVIVAALRVLSGLPLGSANPGWAILWGLCGAVGVSLAAGVYPILRMQRADAVAAVRNGGL